MTKPKSIINKDENKELDINIQKSDKEVALENKVTQLEEMLKNFMNNFQNNNVKEEAVKNTKKIDDEDEDEERIPFNKTIKVMSLINNRLTISTEGDGQGTKYNFVKFGQIRGILYEQLISIVNTNESFANEGVFYIMNSKVVKALGLEEQYKKIMNKETIVNILDLDSEKISNFFTNTTKTVQETIVSILKTKIKNGEYVDLNKVDLISKIYGQDINILAGYEKELYEGK